MRHFFRLFLGSGPDGERHPLFTMLFWAGVISVCATHALNRVEGLLMPREAIFALLVALVGLWPWVRWTSAGPTAPGLILTALVLVLITVEGTGSVWTLLPLTMAQIVVTVNARAGFIAAGVVVATALLSVRFLYDKAWDNAVRQAVSIAVLLVATIMAADLAAQEQRRRLAYADLLDELRGTHAELEAAHHELRLHTDQANALAVAAERARLAREVHDAVGHHLTVVKLDLTNALRLRGRDEDAAWDTVAGARDSAATALDEVRRAVRALAPGPLAASSLGTALKALSDSSSRDGLVVAFEMTGVTRPLGAQADATLYRVAEEALTNVRRHASKAGSARVHLAYDADAVRLTVANDGAPVAGITPGFGLAGVGDRMAEIGGTLTIGAPVEGGVVLAACLPVEDASRRHARTAAQYATARTALAVKP